MTRFNPKALETHKQDEILNVNNPEYRTLVDFYLFGEMERDSGHGDLTTDLIVKKSSEKKEMLITAKMDGVLAGREEIECFLGKLGLEFEWGAEDGEAVTEKTEILSIQGSSEMLEKIERPVLNLLGRMSGVATETRKIVDLVEGRVLVCPTRKVLWGLLDKKACILGGGGTHRLRASDAVLIKENHISLLENGGVSNLKKIFEDSSAEDFGRFCEIEVENKAEFLKAVDVLGSLPEGVQGVIMFDNFSPEEIKNLINKVDDNILFEASGDLDENNVLEYSKTGADIISLGKITHSARNFNFSARIH